MNPSVSLLIKYYYALISFMLLEFHNTVYIRIDTVGVYAISNISFGGWAADIGGFSSLANYFNGYLISAL